MEFKGAMGGLYRITEWITRIAASNLLWLLCSSPFMFFLLMRVMMALKNVNTDSSTLVGMAVLAPFTIFPATTALFTVVRKWVMGEGDLSVPRTYFKGYKENYKQSMIGGVFYTILFVIMAVDMRVYMGKMQNLQLVGLAMLLLLILLSVSMFNFFSMVAHYHMPTRLILKNAILLTIIRPVRILLTAIGAAMVLLLTYKFLWLIALGTASIIAWIAFANFYAAFNKMQAQIAKMNGQTEAVVDGAPEMDQEKEEQLLQPVVYGNSQTKENNKI